MRHSLIRVAILALVTAGFTGCNLCAATLVFPYFDPEYLPEPPLSLGQYTFSERRVEVDDLGDGEPGGITIIAPTNADGPRPAVVWVLGINNYAHYHQSFHEHMASQGFVQIIPDTRDFCFRDLQYHKRNLDCALKTFDRAVRGELGEALVPGNVAFGGYSSGATLAAFAAGKEPRAQALTLWAPSDAPIWLGVDPDELISGITQPILMVLGGSDTISPPGGFSERIRSLATLSPSVSTEVIPDGVHLFFQQPSGVDDRNPFTNITRIEQQRAAISLTRDYLLQRIGNLP